MKTPDFWSRPIGSVALALWPISLLYGGVASARTAFGRTVRASVPVVCVGNFTAGGQGKTPLALAVAEMAKARGWRPIFLSRGHGGRLRGPVAVDPARHRAGDVGDEPLLLAKSATAIVSRDRPAGAAFAASLGADLIVMDDGFQNPSLFKDVSIIASDSGFGIGNGLRLPAGPLRAPLDGQLARTDALVVIGDGRRSDELAERARRLSIPVFAARLEPNEEATDLKGRRVLAYAGIGRPEKFFETLRGAGAELAATRSFPDHHVYGAGEAESLIAEAQRLKAQLATTEKDAARLDGPLKEASFVVGVRLTFDRPEALAERLFAKTREAGRRSLSEPAENDVENSRAGHVAILPPAT